MFNTFGTWFYALITDHNFVGSFFANLFVGIIAAFIIPWYLDRRKIHDSEIYLCETLTRKSEFHMTAAGDGSLEATLKLALKNASPFSLRDLYIAIFIPESLHPSIINKTAEELTTLGPVGESYERLFYRMRGPVYPDRYHNFSFEIKLKAAKGSIPSDTEIINYYVSTEVGIFPKSAGFINDENTELTIERMQNNSAKLKIFLQNAE